MHQDEAAAKITFYAIAIMCAVALAGLVALCRIYSL
jgi:hypothetical protein